MILIWKDTTFIIMAHLKANCEKHGDNEKVELQLTSTQMIVAMVAYIL